jgi:hypothetical protein
MAENSPGSGEQIPETAEPRNTTSFSIPAHVLAWMSLGLLLASLTLFRMSNNDIWIHLKTGEFVLENGWVPDKDPYSFTAADKDYIAHEWLAGVIFFLVHKAWGVTGLIVARAAFIAAACGLLLHTCRLLRGRLSIILPAFACMAYISSARYLTRPHIFSYLMAAAYLWLFFKYREEGRNRKWLYMIPVVHVIWTNIHGGFVQGIALLATFALGETLVSLRASRFKTGEANPAPMAHLKTLWLLVPGCVLASLVNPYGYKILLFPFQLTGMQIFMRSIYEWQPPYHNSYNISTMFMLYMVMVFAACALFFTAHRDRRKARGGGESLGFLNGAMMVGLGLLALFMTVSWLQGNSGWTQGRLEFAMVSIFLLFSGFTLVNYRTVDFTQAGIFALFYLMSLQHNRGVTDAAMIIMVVLVASGSSALEKKLAADASPLPRKKKTGKGSETPPVAPSGPEPFRDRSTPKVLLVSSALVITLAAQVHLDNYFFDFKGGKREKGFGIASNMPLCATEFVRKKEMKGRAFVSYPMAAMLIHRSYPDVKVNMDSRNDVYGEKLYLEFMSALRYPNSMLAYLGKHEIDFMMLSYADRKPDVFEAVMQTGQWAPVFYDTRGFILARRTPENEDLILAEEFRELRPGILGGTSINFQNAGRVLAEAQRTVENCPRSVFGYYYQSKALQALGRHDEALAANLAILEFDPENGSVYGDMGYIYAAQGDLDKAILMYEKSLTLAPGNKAIIQNLENLRQAR